MYFMLQHKRKTLYEPDYVHLSPQSYDYGLEGHCCNNDHCLQCRNNGLEPFFATMILL
jgi:hypothetical protein